MDHAVDGVNYLKQEVLPSRIIMNLRHYHWTSLMIKWYWINTVVSSYVLFRLGYMNILRVFTWNITPTLDCLNITKSAQIFARNIKYFIRNSKVDMSSILTFVFQMILMKKYIYVIMIFHSRYFKSIFKSTVILLVLQIS